LADVGLSEARQSAKQQRAILAGGGDPKSEREAEAARLRAAMGVASVVEAQTATSQSPAGQKTKAQVQAPVRTGPDGSFKDECGFRYNSRGDRIDAQGADSAAASYPAWRGKLQVKPRLTRRLWLRSRDLGSAVRHNTNLPYWNVG
jgi:hypothetical protein